MTRRIAVAAVALSALAAAAPAEAAPADERWEFTGSLNLFLPTVSGSTRFTADGGGSDAGVDMERLLDSLESTFMGSLEARKGPWSLFTDLVYLDFGASKSGSRSLSLGGVPLPAGVTADASLDLTGWSWTLGAGMQVDKAPNRTFGVVGGARMLDVTQELKWTLAGNVGSVPLPDRAGSRRTSLTNWDAVIGFKGRVEFGEGGRWHVPYYLDVGKGESDLTTQAFIGLGYSFSWGGLVGSWRYLDYDMKSDQGIQDLTFSGPMISVVFRW